MCEKHYYYKDGQTADSQVEQCSQAARQGPNTICEGLVERSHTDGEFLGRTSQYISAGSPPTPLPSHETVINLFEGYQFLSDPERGKPKSLKKNAARMDKQRHEAERKNNSENENQQQNVAIESRPPTVQAAVSDLRASTLIEQEDTALSAGTMSPQSLPYLSNELMLSTDLLAIDKFSLSPMFVPAYPPPQYSNSLLPVLYPKSKSAPPFPGATALIPGAYDQPQRYARLAPDSQGREIPLDAQWTRVSRQLISPVVLNEAGVRYEARPDFVAILGVFTKEEISEFARRSAEVRKDRQNFHEQGTRDSKDRYYTGAQLPTGKEVGSKTFGHISEYTFNQHPQFHDSSSSSAHVGPNAEDEPAKELQAEAGRRVEEDFDSSLQDYSDEDLYTEFVAEESTDNQLVASQTLDVGSDQREAMTHGALMSQDAEPSDCPKQEDTGSTQRPWMAAAWYWLAAVLDPPPERGYRATYTCSCGEFCYIDMEELMPGGAEELELEIRKEADFVRYCNPDGNTSPCNDIQKPSPAHLNSSALSTNDAQGAPLQNLPTLSEQSQGNNITETAVQGPASDTVPKAQKYLLLCVHTRHGLVKLVHIDVSALTNDQFLFQEIRNEYKTARQGHDWNLAELVPGSAVIIKWVLALISMISSRDIKIPQWLSGAFQDCRIFVPRKIEFVKFELMPVRLEICAGNIEKPEIPGPEEVQVKRTYEYEPITIKAKILNVPIHELLKPGQHLNRFWWKRFPKKLDSPLTFDEELNCCGWGILITEGWNRPFVLFLCLLAMIVFVVFVALYSVLTKDGSTGAGIGSFMMAILTLYCTLKYEQWKEQ